MSSLAMRSSRTGSIPNVSSKLRLKFEPMTAAALSVRLAFGSRRSMRAAMVACKVTGTLTSPTSAADRYAPGAPRSTPRSASSRTISSAKNGLPAALSAIFWPSAPTEGFGPISSETSAAVSESFSGARANGLSTGHPAQRAPILGAVGDQHQRGRLRDHREKPGQHRLADLVNPVRVLDNKDRRFDAGQPRGID